MWIQDFFPFMSYIIQLESLSNPFFTHIQILGNGSGHLAVISVNECKIGAQDPDPLIGGQQDTLPIKNFTPFCFLQVSAMRLLLRFRKQFLMLKHLQINQFANH